MSGTRVWGGLLGLALVACSGDEELVEGCDQSEKFEVWTDADGDGFGGESLGLVCERGASEAIEGGDCDDADPELNPAAEEVCDGLDQNCDGDPDDGIPGVVFYADADGDGFGDVYTTVIACREPPGAVDDDSDCDDTNPSINREAPEICNGFDDDCDNIVDDDDDDLDPNSLVGWYTDSDGDGFGRADSAALETACEGPTGSVSNTDDCNDNNPGVNPTATETCAPEDEDCDDLVNETDPSLDLSTQSTFYTDADGDGTGDPASPVEQCSAGPGVSANDTDCDDTTPLRAPNRPETLCDTLDNDCDASTTDNPDLDLDGYFRCDDDCDDAQAEVNPAAFEEPSNGIDEDCDTFELCFQDLDADGWRSDVAVPSSDLTCSVAPNAPPDLPVDCDDADPLASSGSWELDADGDGVGDGIVALSQCEDPGDGYAPSTVDIDCDDSNPDMYPGAIDPCGDGFDANCDGFDVCGSCLDHLEAGETVDGAYDIDVDGTLHQVWCDFTTDGGGWTLVASTAGTTLDDAGTNTYYADLATLTPAGGHDRIWSGMSLAAPDTADVRFACKANVNDATMAVDLSFYDVRWYRELVSSGDEGQVCFEENTGTGDTQPTPSRKNNRTGVTLLLGDAYGAGYLEGEDSCADSGDFTVDFDDRGMDSNQMDGTDWGEDDATAKCGVVAGQAWFLFVRELP